MTEDLYGALEVLLTVRKRYIDSMDVFNYLVSMLSLYGIDLPKAFSMGASFKDLGTRGIQR